LGGNAPAAAITRPARQGSQKKRKKENKKIRKQPVARYKNQEERIMKGKTSS